jgi:hypothetical protein
MHLSEISIGHLVKKLNLLDTSLLCHSFSFCQSIIIQIIYIAQYHAYTEVRRVWLIGDPYINLIPCIVRNGPVHHIIFTSPPSKVDRTPTLHTCDQTPVDGLVGPKSYMVELELVPTYVETYLDTFRVKANFESISPTLFVRLSLLSRHLT